MALGQLNKQTSNYMKKKLAKSGQRWDSEKKKKKKQVSKYLCVLLLPTSADFLLLHRSTHVRLRQ
jgi:hypothetical protein